MRPLLIALQFLTRLPVRLAQPPQAQELGRSVLFYPLVGLVLGLMLMAAARGLDGIPVALGAALLLVLWVGLTGALHLDGLADSVDAWAGGRGERERTLALMKDPSSGPMGVTALVLVLLVKYAALSAVLAQEGGEVLLLLAPLLGRSLLLLLFLTTPYVRSGGLGALPAAHLPRVAAVAVLLLSIAVVVAIAGASGWTALVAAVGVFVVLRAAMCARLGGTTGDTAGALVEISEAAMLVAVVAFLPQ